MNYCTLQGGDLGESHLPKDAPTKQSLPHSSKARLLSQEDEIVQVILEQFSGTAEADLTS
jgi:hypothetical protein